MSAAKKLVDDLKLPDLSDETDLDQSTFEFFAKKMYDLSGVNLPYSSKNLALVKNRMSKLIRKKALRDLDHLKEQLKNPNPAFINDFISALTTNKTHFFREEAHFDFLKQYLPTHFKSHSDLRIWCAAASTGQEPYTLAMVVRDHISESDLGRTKMLCTDIDLQVLDKASQGLYTDSEMEGCPEPLRKKYFEKVPGPQPKYRAKDEINKMLRFAPFNLVKGEYKFSSKFHLIFCRNVLIYFDQETTKFVIDSLASQLAPGGYLILGHSESGSVKNDKLKPLSRAMYQRV